MSSSLLPKAQVSQITDQDTLVILGSALQKEYFDNTPAAEFFDQLQHQQQHLSTFSSDGGVFAPVGLKTPIKRVVYTPLGPLNRDFDDPRRFYDAACTGVKKAIKNGGRRILLVLTKQKFDAESGYQTADYKFAPLVTVLGAYEAIYQPIELLEAKFESKIDSLSFNLPLDCPRMLATANAIEEGRIVARDIGGSDPERMSPLKTAEYVQKALAGTDIKVQVINDKAQIEKEFPCLGAVNRGSNAKQLGCVILLTYEPTDKSKIERTLGFVGKGVTFDTGGHDIKAGGIMAGMSRDCCGAAATAGLFKTLSILKPDHVRVIGALAMVRNSIGPDAYVSDELIVSRAGVRVRVGNTDAEGRMAMVDLLCYLREQILANNYANAQLFTIATLTGHAVIVSGNYTMVMDNGPARISGTGAKAIIAAGERLADPAEFSTIRIQDYEFCRGKSEYEDVLQCNNAASSRTPRGHQFPAAFLIIVSGLDKHGLDSKQPISYTHIDIAASSGPYPGIPSGSPIVSLVGSYFIKCHTKQ